MNLEQHIFNNYKVDENGVLKKIRSKCFNGNELLMPITLDDIEDIWNEAIESINKSNKIVKDENERNNSV